MLFCFILLLFHISFLSLSFLLQRIDPKNSEMVTKFNVVERTLKCMWHLSVPSSLLLSFSSLFLSFSFLLILIILFHQCLRRGSQQETLLYRRTNGSLFETCIFSPQSQSFMLAMFLYVSLLLLDLFLPLPVLLSLSLSLSTPSLICIDCLFQEADVNTGNNHTQAVAKSLASSNDPPPILISAKIEEEVYLPSPHPLSTFYSLAYPHLHLTHILPHFSPPCHPSSLSSLLPPPLPLSPLLVLPSPLLSSLSPSSSHYPQLANLDNDEAKQEFLSMYGMTSYGLKKIITTSRELTGLSCYYTVGPTGMGVYGGVGECGRVWEGVGECG